MLNYWRYGSGPTLVLQHGTFGGGRYWTPQMAEFGAMFDVIAPDLPGFSGSGHISPPDTVEGFTEALLGLMDDLGVERFSLVGHSLSGMIAQQMALDHPDRLQRLVLYGTAPSGSLPTRFETHKETIARIKKEGLAGAGPVMQSWFVNGEDHPYYALCEQASQGATVEAGVNVNEAVPRWDVRERLGEIGVPTLIICGDRDRATTPDHAYELWRGIPDSHLCIVPNCSHCVHLEKPEVFNRIVGRFVFAGD